MREPFEGYRAPTDGGSSDFFQEYLFFEPNACGCLGFEQPSI